MSNDKRNFFTYSKDHLSLAFPLVNEHEAARQAKLDNQAKWKNASGFVKQKKENFNLHDKKPPVSVQDALKSAYYIERAFTEECTVKKEYRPTKFGKAEYSGKVKGVETFSDEKFFKTVFATGDDA